MLLNHNNPVDLRKKVMYIYVLIYIYVYIYIYYMAFDKISKLSAGDQFNLTKSTVHMVVKEITNVLVDILPN